MALSFGWPFVATLSTADMATRPPHNPDLPYLPSPVCATSAGVVADAETLSRTEIEAYAGANGRVYWDMLSASASSRSLLAGFNVAAAVLPWPWLAYRKMFRECALVFTMGVFLAALLSAIPIFRGRAFLVDYLVPSVAIGLLGNGLYLRRIRIVAAQIRRSEPDPDCRAFLLAEHGGTSWFAAVILALGSALLKIALKNWTRL